MAEQLSASGPRQVTLATLITKVEQSTGQRVPDALKPELEAAVAEMNEAFAAMHRQDSFEAGMKAMGPVRLAAAKLEQILVQNGIQVPQR